MPKVKHPFRNDRVTYDEAATVRGFHAWRDVARSYLREGRRDVHRNINDTARAYVALMRSGRALQEARKNHG